MTDVDNLGRMATPSHQEGLIFRLFEFKNAEIGDTHAVDRLLNSLATRAL